MPAPIHMFVREPAGMSYRSRGSQYIVTVNNRYATGRSKLRGSSLRNWNQTQRSEAQDGGRSLSRLSHCSQFEGWSLRSTYQQRSRPSPAGEATCHGSGRRGGLQPARSRRRGPVYFISGRRLNAWTPRRCPRVTACGAKRTLAAVGLPFRYPLPLPSSPVTPAPCPHRPSRLSSLHRNSTGPVPNGYPPDRSAHPLCLRGFPCLRTSPFPT